MEFSSPVLNLRSDICIILRDVPLDAARGVGWSAAAEDFLRKIHRLGLTFTIIGPKPKQKFGSAKKSVHFLDRHEVVSLKELTVSLSKPLELRILNRKNKSWIRLRTEICITVGENGRWPIPFEGWNLPGVLPITAAERFALRDKWIPRGGVAFLGSPNRTFRLAHHFQTLGIKPLYVIEPKLRERCWRVYRDRFVSAGGRLLKNHQIIRASGAEYGLRSLTLKNENQNLGNLILDVDNLILAPATDEQAINSPEEWKRGLFYVQRRYSIYDTRPDEEIHLEELDWKELYWRIGKKIERIEHGEADGSLQQLKSLRKKYLAYRREETELGYSGKILDRETTLRLRQSVSVPKELTKKTPVASLECFQEIACRVCADACPDDAISLKEVFDLPKIDPVKCTGCGACVAVCPAGCAVMIADKPDRQKVRFHLPEYSDEIWRGGEQLQVLNRRGENLGIGRVVGEAKSYKEGRQRILEIEAADIHLWEARNFRTAQAGNMNDEPIPTPPPPQSQIWVEVNGKRRLFPKDGSLSLAFLNIGLRRHEDAFYCEDGTCGRCEVEVDGKRALACQTKCKEESKITVPQEAKKSSSVLCPCKAITQEFYDETLAECGSTRFAREHTGVGLGACKGRWCLNASDEVSARPFFGSYDASPWRDFSFADFVDTDDLS